MRLLNPSNMLKVGNDDSEEEVRVGIDSDVDGLYSDVVDDVDVDAEE